MISKNGPAILMQAGIAALAVATISSPALADDSSETKAGVLAWQQGRFDEAVALWQRPAANGYADAQFNLGQAYKVGRGAPKDLDMALGWYRKAMDQGHVQAADYYGLVLYQKGEKPASLPYIRTSAERGEPRAQYVYGAELFNGTLVPKDWPRAYAMMTRAQAAGLPQASRVLAEMDGHIPLAQRQQGLAMADELEQTELRNRSAQMAAQSTGSPQPLTKPGGEATARSIELPPSSVAQGTPDPAVTNPGVGATYAPPSSYPANETREVQVAQPVYTPPPTRGGAAAQAEIPVAAQSGYTPSSQPREVAVASGDMSNELPAGYVPSVPPGGAKASSTGKTTVKPSGGKSLTKPADTASASGWRVQMGAFSNLDNARKRWDTYEPKVATLQGRQPYLVQSGKLVKLQYGPFATRAEALQSCSAVERAGVDCFVLKK